MARQTKAESDLVLEARDFLQEREGAESENRENMLADLRFAFIPGAQWDELARTRRRGRPCYTYNRTVGAINQVIGDQRMTHPQGKVRALNDSAAQTAEKMGGIIRSIEAMSSAEDVYDEAFKYAVAGGWGCWRIVPEYADDESFDQTLRIMRVPNPMTMFFDGLADPYGRGASRVLVADRISIEQYRAQYGKKRQPSNMPVPRDSQGWFGEKEVRIAEFYRKDYTTRELALLSDGRVEVWSPTLERTIADAKASNIQVAEVVRRRTVKSWFVEWVKTDGVHVLEGPIEYPYLHIPAVRLPGRFINIEGKQFFQSLILHSKDAQRTYNYDRSAMVETVALSPNAKWLVTNKMIKGHEQEWAAANVSTQPYLSYDVDPDAPTLQPQRQPGADVPQAYMALAAHDAEDIRQTTGYINPALDQPTMSGDAESGKALRTRLMTSDSGTYEFLDNFGKAIQFTHEIVLDMLPVHIDTARKMRVLGQDGRESFWDFDPEALKKARHEVTVTLGPSYATARMEALDMLLSVSQAVPAITELGSDVILRNLDIKGADELEERVRLKMIQQNIIAPTEKDMQAMAKLPPPPPPDPTQVALAESLQAKTAKDVASAQKTQVETQQALASAEVATRREVLELRELFEDVRNKQAETALLLKELRAPAATPNT